MLFNSFAGALGAGMFGFDDDMEENPFIDDALFDDDGLLEGFTDDEDGKNIVMKHINLWVQGDVSGMQVVW